MKKLKPKAPRGVKYALSVPQSVLFADLSLQGNLKKYFTKVLRIDYEPSYIVIDAGGAMSWNYDNDLDFNASFTKDRSLDEAVTNFIAAMGTTARKLDRRSSLGSATIRRKGNTQDIVNDLLEYWHAYKLHMTSLFTFWNVEALLRQAITEELHSAGINIDKVELDEFIKSKEHNQFIRERHIFEKLVRRFANDLSVSKKNASPELLAALEHHIREFSFLLTPFNLGSKPSPEILLERVNEVQNTQPASEQERKMPFAATTPRLKKLIDLIQQMTFWKNERLDVLSMADARMELLYKSAAEILNTSTDKLFTMTSEEILKSLDKQKVIVNQNMLDSRVKAFCLILSNGTIDFYEPSMQSNHSKIPQAEIGTQIYGVIASKGVTRGIARVIDTTDDLEALKAGEILITKMTRPEYGTALDRAAAFVTDEGGMLCHAAIISREMKKPCIIGTKDATQIMKTGMKIEVDANKGTVTILELAKQSIT